jgi:hypothetical protein
MPDKVPAAVLAKLAESVFSDIDLESAVDTLEKHKLPIQYTDEAVAALNDAVNVLFEKQAKLKDQEAPRAKRRELKLQIDDIVNARAFLYRIRDARPGDVTAEPLPVGAN